MKFLFVSPEYLLILFVIPFLILVYFYTLRLGKTKALKFANFEAISRIQGVDLYSKNISVLFINVIIVILLVFAVADFSVEMETDISAYSFVIAIDNSESMSADDIYPNRIEAAKEIAENFIDSSPIGTKIGLVSFSGNALIEHEVSKDKEELKLLLGKIGLSEVGGTDLYEAILTSSNLLSNHDKKIVILLSDGQINVGSIERAVSFANEKMIIVHAIALGTKEGGQTSYGISKVDEDSLRSLSYSTRGQYFFASSNEELSAAFSSILALKRGEALVSFSNYLIIAALILILLEFILINTRFKMFP